MKATIHNVTNGTKLKTLCDFGCTKEGAIVTVQGHDNDLYFSCHDGRHYLDGQLDGGIYVNLEVVK